VGNIAELPSPEVRKSCPQDGAGSRERRRHSKGGCRIKLQDRHRIEKQDEDEEDREINPTVVSPRHLSQGRSAVILYPTSV
jgi:hypothetical protein